MRLSAASSWGFLRHHTHVDVRQPSALPRGTAAAEKARLSSSHGRKGAQEKQRQNMYQRLCCTAVSRPFYRKRADGILRN